MDKVRLNVPGIETEDFDPEKEHFVSIPRERDLANPRMIRLWREAAGQRRTKHNLSLLVELERNMVFRYNSLKILEEDGWYLVFDPGFSIVELAQIFGCDPNMPPCRDDKSSAWLAEGNSPWAKERQEPGYYLISMPLLCGLSGDHQDTAIRDLLGGKFERAPSRLAVVFGLSHFLAFGNYGFNNCHHLGPEESGLVGAKTNCVVAFDLKRGLALYNFSRGGNSKGMGVCLVRKFDLDF